VGREILYAIILSCTVGLSTWERRKVVTSEEK